MITVRLDGAPWQQNISGVRTMGELVEFVKSNIDPEKIITSLSINGQDLTDGDWRAPLSIQGENVLDVTTGSAESYVVDRLQIAVELVQEITEEFSRARESYQQGGSRDGNVGLNKAVSDLRAFLDWYYSVLSLIPGGNRVNLDGFRAEVGEVTKICEQLLQQQLYQSWWALGQTLQSKLEPKLGELKSFCERSSASFAGPVAH